MRSRLALGFVLFAAGCSGNIDEPSKAISEDSGAPAIQEETSVDPRDDAEPSDPGGEGQEGSGDLDAGVIEVDASDSGSDSGSVGETGGVDAAPTDVGAPKKSASSIFVAEAGRELAAMKESTYSHTTHVVESTGTFDFDCSGFVDYALGRVLSPALATVQSSQGTTRPLAKDFEAFFAGITAGSKKGGWSRVSRAIELAPGDVVAWLKPADVDSTNTGHVLIVRLLPTTNPKRTDEVLVPIYDSTASPHGSADSRAPSGDGLGTGTIGLLVDGKGAPIGYRWTGATSVKLEYTGIALGHLVD